MNVVPLFVATMTELKRNLRLSGVTAGDAVTMIDTAVQQARLKFYDRLGAARITEISGYVYSENPSTDTGYQRFRANHCEVLMVRAYLLRSMPVLFRDDRSQGQQSWNEEGLTRDMGQRLLNREIDRIDNEVEEMLVALEAGENDNSVIQTKVMGPVGANCAPGSSVFNTCGVYGNGA